MRNTANVILALILLTAAPLSAWSSSWDININTSSLLGTNATLVFDFVDGDAAINNTVHINQFLTDGSLGPFLPIGDVSGNLGGGIHFGDSQFSNTFEEQLILGNSLKFQLQATNLFDSSGMFPDAFAFYILNDVANQSLVATDDPFGLDALLAIDLNGTSNGLSVYADTSGATTWSVEPVTSGVPTPGTLLLCIAGIAAALFNRKARDL